MRLPPLVPQVRTTVLGLAVVAVCATTAFTQAPAPAVAPTGAAAAASRPPVLDRELFFGDPEISGAQISPDGQYIAFIKPYKDTRNIWVKKADEPFDAARLDHRRHEAADPRLLLEPRQQVHPVRPGQGRRRELQRLRGRPGRRRRPPARRCPAARNLTDAKGARAMIYAVPEAHPDVIYVGLNDRDAAWHDLYQVTHLDRRAHAAAQEHGADRRLGVRPAGPAATWQRGPPTAGDTEILRVDGDTLKPVYTCTVFEIVRARPLPQGQRARVHAVEQGRRERLRPPGAARPGDVAPRKSSTPDPLGRVDFGDAVFSEATEELTATWYEDDRKRVLLPRQGGRGRLQPRDEAAAGTRRRVHVRHRGRAAVAAGAPTATSSPARRYLFDRGTKKLTLQYRVREKLPRERARTDDRDSLRIVRRPGDSGVPHPAEGRPAEEPAARRRPARRAMGPRHVGLRQPWRSSSPTAATPCCSPTSARSTGYGKKFLNAGNKQWGEKMQDDITWGVKHLVSQGIADPKRVGIMGGSYGGYATLAGVAFTPDVYAAGVVDRRRRRT